MGSRSARAVDRSKALGRAFAGALIAGLVYDATKAALARLWRSKVAGGSLDSHGEAP